MQIEVRGKKPQLGSNGFIAPGAKIIGEVRAGENCSFWFNTVIRGDVSPIVIGDKVNIQDGSVIHGTYEQYTVRIGDRVSIGHTAIVHGCEIEDDCLIGMGAILMDGCHIGASSVVAAGSLVSPGKKFPPRSVIMGRPAKVVREISEDELKLISATTENYLKYMKWFENGEVKGD